MRMVTFEVEFKRNWSNIEIEGVMAIIKNYADETGDIFGDTDSWGYNSESPYAMLWYQDLNLMDEYHGTLEISHIGITTNDMLILICQDDDENNILFELEPSDF